MGAVDCFYRPLFFYACISNILFGSILKLGVTAAANFKAVLSISNDLFFPGLLSDGRICVLGNQLLSVISGFASVCERYERICSERKTLFCARIAVFLPPQLASMRHDFKIQPTCIEQLVWPFFSFCGLQRVSVSIIMPPILGVMPPQTCPQNRRLYVNEGTLLRSQITKKPFICGAFLISCELS